MFTSGGLCFGAICSISMLTSFVSVFCWFLFLHGWDGALMWLRLRRWGASRATVGRIIHKLMEGPHYFNQQNGQGYLKAFLISWLKMLTLFSSLSFKSLSYEKHMRSQCRISVVVHDNASECCVDIVLFKLEDAKNRSINIYIWTGVLFVLCEHRIERINPVLRCQ